MADVDRLRRLLAALGAEDPEGWAESEVQENLPQLARYRLLRALSRDIEAWDAATVDSLRDGMKWAEGARLADPVAEATRIARAVARETVFSVLYRLADPNSDDLPAELRQQMPGWVLMETTPVGGPTHRVLDALFEDLDTTDSPAAAPSDRIVAEGWMRETSLRTFCESLAAEAGYDFDDSDWLAIGTALPHTDDEQPRSVWYAYPLVGRTRVDLRVARSVGGSEVSVSVRGMVDSRTRIRVELLVDVMARYAVAPG
ncbi:hypothetical protein AB0D86_04755 [Streptomyces sp. NPDC048324]|uniref:hypothetical protein n=1 Tax=Streptomyces sp. NPDC048324 TaxID=3157205 RepID=UPI003435F039